MYSWIALFMFAGCALISGMKGEISFIALGCACACLMFSSISLNRNELRRREILELRQDIDNHLKAYMKRFNERYEQRMKELGKLL